MPKRVIIPITDEADANACTGSYEVRYHVVGSEFWQTLTPAPLASPIVIENLADATLYEVEIKRVCCSGQKSVATTVEVDTTDPEP